MTIGQSAPDQIWKLAEQAVVEGDAAALEALLREHGQMLRTGPVHSTWWGGLAPRYADGDARTIIVSEHFFENWAEFAAHAAARRQSGSPVAQFEAAVDSIVDGDRDTLTRLLRETPDLVRARSARTHHSTLLHYVGANGVEGFRQRTPGNAIEVARILLDAGAEIDATADMYGGGSTTLGLIATSIHPVTAGVQEGLLAFFLERGASVGDAQGVSAWSNLINGCHANGRGAAAQFLAERAPGLDLEAAAGVGRLDVVKQFFTTDGGLTGATAKQLQDGFTWACEFGRSDVVEFLLQRGVNAAAKLRHHGQTGLHWAALGGHAGTVRVLLKHDASVHARDEEFDGTPLGWAIYGWGGGASNAGREEYYDVVRQLVAAGATIDESWLAESDRGYPLGQKIREDTRMRAALGLP